MYGKSKCATFRPFSLNKFQFYKPIKQKMNFTIFTNHWQNKHLSYIEKHKTGTGNTVSVLVKC